MAAIQIPTHKLVMRSVSVVTCWPLTP